MVQKKLTLTLPAPGQVGDRVIDKRPTFELTAEPSITHGIRTDFLVGEGGDKVLNTILNSLANDESKYKKAFLNVGTGQRTVQVAFQGYTGSPHVWGDPDSSSPPYNATGEDALTQMQVLDYFLAISAPDSFEPARIEFGGYAPGEFFDTELNEDHLNVVIEQPGLTWSAGTGESQDTITGEITFVESIVDKSLINDIADIVGDSGLNTPTTGPTGPITVPTVLDGAGKHSLLNTQER